MKKVKIVFAMDYYRIPSWEYYLGNAMQKTGLADAIFVVGEIQNRQNLKIDPKVIVLPPQFSLPDFHVFKYNLFYNTLKKLRPDFVIAVNLKNIQLTFSSFAKSDLGFKLVLKEHTPRTFLRKRYSLIYIPYLIWLRLQGAIAKKYIDGAICITDAQRIFVSKYCKTNKPIEIIPSGVETTVFKPDRNVEREKAVVYIGRYFYTKLREFLPVIPSLISNFPDWKFVFVGDGSWSDRIKVLCERFPNNIQDLGYINHDKLASIINKCSIGILPSTQVEPFGLTSLEVQSCGIPVIVSDIEGLRTTVVDNRSGLVVKPVSEKIALALCDLMSNKKKREKLGKSARGIAVEKYDWGVIAKKTIEFLIRL